jgi:hypothetical protein
MYVYKLKIHVQYSYSGMVEDDCFMSLCTGRIFEIKFCCYVSTNCEHAPVLIVDLVTQRNVLQL